ncbi:MAG: aldehyde dehydrogenase family protein [Actinomycetota bacterium]
MNATDTTHLVIEAGQAAKRASAAMASAAPAAVRAALEGMAANLRGDTAPVLAANAADVAAAEAGGMTDALLDRLRLDAGRLEKMAGQIAALAAAPDLDPVAGTWTLPDGVVVEDRRRPVGVIGANYEARPNVTVDIASQLVKSRNAGVLRTGSAALASALALLDHVIRPAMRDAGLDPQAVQLVRSADRSAAYALCAQPKLIPLVIIRGSGPTTAALGAHAAAHGVRTLAHADGGGVLFVDRDADVDAAHALIRRSLDRLGVCNRLNLLLLAADRYDELLPGVVALLQDMGIRASLPPHPHPLGHEWALDDGNEATVTIASAADAAAAAEIANDETSGIAAGIATRNAATAEAFLTAYAGTGGFWNVTTRRLDGFELTAAPETGINVDHVPGPRGPVTFRDLVLRQYVVRPPAA